MLQLADILKPEGVVPHLTVKSKKQVLCEIARRVQQIYGVDEKAVFRSLIERERLGSTIIAEGVAFPHAKMANIREYMMMFIRLSDPVIFDDYEKESVDLVLMLLVPDRGGAEHLRLFASFSQLFSDTQLCDNLRQARSQTSAILSLLHIELADDQKKYSRYSL